MKQQGRWPSEEPSPRQQAAVAYILGDLAGIAGLGSQAIEEGLSYRLGLAPSPCTVLDELARASNELPAAAEAHRWLVGHDHRDVVEAYVDMVGKRGQLGQRLAHQAAAHINEAWSEHGYAFRLRKVRDQLHAHPTRSRFLDRDATEMAFELLENHRFAGPLKEFEEALGSLRDGDHDAAQVKANKAFESTMKAIWAALEPDARVHKKPAELLKKMIALGLLDPVHRPVLEALPNLRNQPGSAHGAGSTPCPVDCPAAELAVHLAGSFIVFLINRYEDKLASSHAPLRV